MLTLRLAHRREPGGAHAVDVSLDDGGVVERASSRFDFPVDAADREQLRWYLEDYLEFPLDPAPRLAAAAEARLGELGSGAVRVGLRRRGGRPVGLSSSVSTNAATARTGNPSPEANPVSTMPGSRSTR